MTVLDRIPKEQRLMVIATAVLAVVAGAFAAAAILASAGKPAVQTGRYEPFRVGLATRVAATVRHRPLFFADPTGGTRGFALTLADGDFAALHVVPPGNPRSCPIDWNLTRERFEDCRHRVWKVSELRRFAVRLESMKAGKVVVVDLRKVLPAEKAHA